MQLFESEAIRSQARELEIEIPNPMLDAFVQKKMSKVRVLLDMAQERPDAGTGGNPDAIKKLKDFVDAFQNLKKDEIKTSQQWETFVGQYIVQKHQADWQARLHFDHVLLNFGFEQDTATALQKAETKDGDETVKLEQHSLRWLSKALSAFGVPATMCDIVNLVFAMQKKTNQDIEELKKADGSDSKIAAVIEEFGEKMKRKTPLKDMWVPDGMVLDGETDDTLAWLLLECVRKCIKKKPPRILAQIPAKDIDEGHRDKVEAVLKRHNVEVFRDEDSTNAKPLLTNFQRFLN